MVYEKEASKPIQLCTLEISVQFESYCFFQNLKKKNMLNNITNSTYNCMLIVCINYSPWKHINFKQFKKKASKKHYFFFLRITCNNFHSCPPGRCTVHANRSHSCQSHTLLLTLEPHVDCLLSELWRKWKVGYIPLPSSKHESPFHIVIAELL